MSEPTRSSSLNKPAMIPGFAPADPTDSREPLDWRSKYTEPSAQRGIKVEAVYLAILLFAIPIAMLIVWLDCPKRLFSLTDEKYKPILTYGLAWLSGALGGTLYDVKWLYHSVARQVWHLDRRLWRLFTPHISGGLGFAFVALISSGLLRIFDRQAVESRSLVAGVGFLVGYFSDSALAKLAEIAETLFGASRSKERHKPTSKPDGGGSAASKEASNASESEVVALAGTADGPTGENGHTEPKLNPEP